jgi:hypothetical protein
MAKARSLLALFLLAFVVTGLGAGAAHADAPLDVKGKVTDTAGVLGGDTARVQKALDAFTDETGFQLFVVYVRSFDGASGPDWADQTAARSGLGATDILLAVATDDRRYGIAVPRDHAISDEDFTKVEIEDIRPRLSDGDWAGAAIAAARGYTAAAEESGLPWGPIVIGGIVVAGVGAYAVHRIRRRYASTHVVLDEHGRPVDPLAGLSTDELGKRASAALVSIDDAIKTSEQELGYAEAQFGKEATSGFAQALADSRETVKAAFGLRQRLDDSDEDSDIEIRRMSTEIVSLCAKADATLDAQVATFDELRDLQAKVPQVLEDVAARADEVSARLLASRATLAQLASAHPATSLASVDRNADQAEALLGSARAEVREGDTALASDDRAVAVIHARAAEDAVGQAVTLLDAIDSADADLAAAPGRINERLTGIGLDIADAARLAPQDAGIGTAVTTARSAVSYAQQPGHDPIAAANGLESAEAQLDELLAPVRAAAAEAEKARVALTKSLGRVASRVKGVSEFIETRRGAVGAGARTRLSEAARHLDHAQRVLTGDPGAALTALQEAESFVDEADKLAQQDVAEWERSQRTSSGSGGGGFGSMVLGGILIDALTGGRDGDPGSSSTSGSDRGPGSFGGSGTRARRGGGGRF